MRKGAVFGVIAAFVIIAMLIFIPVMVRQGTTPADADGSTSAEGTQKEPSGNVTDGVTETQAETVHDTTADPATDALTEDETESQTDDGTETTAEADGTSSAETVTSDP